MKKTVLVLLMVLLSVMLVVSCKDSPKAEEKKIEYEDLVGTWKQGNDNDYIKIQFTSESKATMNDKTAQYTSTYDKVNMTVTLKDNVLTFTDSVSNTFTYKVSFDGDKLVLTQEGESSMGNYHADKKYTMEKVTVV